MKAINKPTEQQIQLLMNLISIVAVLGDESIGDCFDFVYFNPKRDISDWNHSNEKEFLPDFGKWAKKNKPELYKKFYESEDEEEDDNNIDYDGMKYSFWIEKSAGVEYSMFRECIKWIYANPMASNGVAQEIECMLENDQIQNPETDEEPDAVIDGYKEETPFGSFENYIAAWNYYCILVGYKKGELDNALIDKLFGEYSSDSSDDDDDEDFDFDAALADKKNDDEDFDFDAALANAPKNLYFLDEIYEDGNGGADLAILPASDADEDFENMPSIHVDDLSELNGVDEGDYFYYDEKTGVITPANDSDFAKQMSDESNRLRQELIKRSEESSEDDDDFDFDAALGPISKSAKKLLGDLAASGAQIHGVAPGGGIGGRLNVDKNGNIKIGNPDNIESKNSKSGSFDKQKGWKDVPDFDPKAAAEKRRREREEMKKDDEIDMESFEQDFKAMLGDDFDFERDVE